MKLAALALLALAACATVRDPDYNGAPDASFIGEKARQCLQTGPCIVLQVDNANYSDAVLYVNSARFEFAVGMKRSTFFVPRSRLDGAGCLSMRVRLIAGASITTTKECPQEGESLQLSINPLFSTTNLVPMLNR